VRVPAGHLLNLLDPLLNPGLFAIGDTLSDGEPLRFAPSRASNPSASPRLLE
jgi:hypothetical protein